MIRRIIPLIALLLLMLSACSPGEGSAIQITDIPPDPTNTPEPTATDLPPTATPIPTETPTPIPTATPEPEGVFIPASQSAVIGSPRQYLDPGGSIYYDGVFHMFPNSFTGWPAPVEILHATSDDGRKWRLNADIQIASEDVPYSGLAALASDVIVLDDGTWVLFFYTWEGGGSNPDGRVGRATAPGPEGPWTVEEQAVLEPGPEGAWDGKQITAPSVLIDEDGLWYMFYAGNNGGKQQIGMATSPDGINWTKYNIESTTADLVAESDPVFTTSAGQWDGTNVWQPNVQLTPDGFVMLYKADGPGQGKPAHGIATSEDGINWTRHPENPVLLGDGSIRGGDFVWFTDLLYQDDTYYIFAEWSKDMNATTQVFVLTHEGSITE